MCSFVLRTQTMQVGLTEPENTLHLTSSMSEFLSPGEQGYNAIHNGSPSY